MFQLGPRARLGTAREVHPVSASPRGLDGETTSGHGLLMASLLSSWPWDSPRIRCLEHDAIDGAGARLGRQHFMRDPGGEPSRRDGFLPRSGVVRARGPPEPARAGYRTATIAFVSSLIGRTRVERHAGDHVARWRRGEESVSPSRPRGDVRTQMQLTASLWPDERMATNGRLRGAMSSAERYCERH
jgi:hypothetical protein